MKLALPLIPVVAIVTALGIGCSTKKQAASGPLDIDAPASSTAVTSTPPVYTPPPAPVYKPPPAPTEPTAAAPAKPALPATASSYTVQRGDTLFKIAQDHYGDGNKWQRIASANPGVNASNLKVGQKLKVP